MRFDEVRAEYRQFPAPEVHAAFAALGRTDSVTVDPHKLGYLPFGAGAFICRDHRAMALLAEEADYVFHDHRADGLPGALSLARAVHSRGFQVRRRGRRGVCDAQGVAA